MNIWILQTGELLPLSPTVRRMRSGLLAAELARRGHAVTWWSSAFDHFSKSWITRSDSVRTLDEGVTLRLLAGIGYRRNISVRRFVDHMLVARKFARAARAMPLPDLIVAALPDHRIAYEAYTFAREHRIPFIVDLRDRWPWDFLPLLPARLQGPARWALARDFRLATEIIREADGLTTMMESWIEWARRDLGRHEARGDRTFYLGAQKPGAATSVKNAVVQQVARDWQSKWIALFVGAFTRRSAPTIIIEAAKLIERSYPHLSSSIRFVLAGDGEYMEAVRRTASGLENVALPGFVNDPEISALLALSKVGIVTANVDFHGVPNKVFTYLSGGLPLISAVGGELEGLIASEEIGVGYWDADSLAKAIVRLHEDERLRSAMSARAVALFARRFDSTVVFKDFADYIERVRGAAGPLASDRV